MTQTHAPDARQRDPAELPFDTIKARARRTFIAAVEMEAACRRAHCDGASPNYRALLPFIRRVAAERDTLCDFVLALAPPNRNDWLAQQARQLAEQGQIHWSQQLLQVRETGLCRIDRWDVRCVAQLIRLFPDCVPKAWRHAELVGYVAEPSGEWLVSPKPASRRID